MPLTETSKPEEKASEPLFLVPPKLVAKPGQEGRVDEIIRKFSVHYQVKNVLVEKANSTLLNARDALLKSINTPPEECVNRFRPQYKSPAKSLSSLDLSFVNISRSAGIALDVRHFQIASFRLALAREIDPYEDKLLYNFLLSLTEGEGLKEEKPFEEKIKENLCKLLNLSTNYYDRLIKYDQEDTEFQETYRYFYTEIFEKLNLKLQKIFSSHEIIVPLIKIITNTLCKNNDIINIYEKNSLPSFVVTCVNLTITLLGELCNDISIATDSPKSTQVSKYDDDLKEERLPIPKIDHKKKEKDVWNEIFQLILVADIQPFDLENDFLNKLHESININKVEHDFIAQKITELILEKLKEHNIISYNNIKPVSSENPVHTSDTRGLNDKLQCKSAKGPVTNEGSDDCQSDEEGYWDTELSAQRRDALKTPTTSFSVRRNSDDARTITAIETIVDQLEAVLCKLNKSNVSHLSSIETAASIIEPAIKLEPTITLAKKAEDSKKKESESISNSLSILSTRTKIFIQELEQKITDIENSFIDLEKIEMESHEKSNRKADKKVQTEKKVEENVKLSPPKPKTPREEKTHLVIKLLALEKKLKEATNISIILQSININNKEISNRLAIEIRQINDNLRHELVELNKELENELNELKTKFNLLQKKNDRLEKDAKKVHEEDKTKLEHGSKVQEPGSKKDDKQKFPILKEQNKQPKNKKDYSKRSTTPIVGSPMVSEMISKCCSIS
jgi:hypothetical protein